MGHGLDQQRSVRLKPTELQQEMQGMEHLARAIVEEALQVFRGFRKRVTCTNANIFSEWCYKSG